MKNIKEIFRPLLIFLSVALPAIALMAALFYFQPDEFINTRGQLCPSLEQYGVPKCKSYFIVKEKNKTTLSCVPKELLK